MLPDARAGQPAFEPGLPSQESVELATLQWVHWFNDHRLLESIGYIPPTEAEASYYQQFAEKDKLAA